MNAAEFFNRKITPLGGGAQSGRPHDATQEPVSSFAQGHWRVVVGGVG